MSVQGSRMPCDLSDPSDLLKAGPASDPPSDALLRFSYELAVTAYDFDIERWEEAGWIDFSFRINDRLFTGADVNNEDGGFHSKVISSYNLIRARQRVRFASPAAQLKGRRDQSDHAKAVFMLFPHGERFIVAIGFTGTCLRLDDWLPNLLMDEKDGLHAGFLCLSREIWKASSQVSFPACAQLLGLESLSLADIIRECGSENSRFMIWMSGHSQGGAVMQLFARYLRRKGVLPENMIGCSFAAPSVLWQAEPCDTRLYLIMNSDDLIPRFGARSHYGHLWLADLNEQDRRLCYSSSVNIPCVQVLFDLARQIRTTEDALLVTCCLLEVFRDQDTVKAPKALDGFLSYLKVDATLRKMEDHLDKITERIRNRALRYYRAFSGREDLDPVQYGRTMQALLNVMDRFGDASFARSLKTVLYYPHRIKNSESGHRISPYYLICETGDYALRSVNDSDIEIRPPRRYAGTLPSLYTMDTHRRHLKHRRFRFIHSRRSGRHA